MTKFKPPSREITPEQYLAYGILEKWHDKRLEDFTNCAAALKVVKSATRRMEEMYADGVGLFLWGANGTGKTHLMNCAFKAFAEKGAKVHIITLSTLITMFTTSWYETEERHALRRILSECHFLGIEEIGKEFKSSTDLASVVLDSIVKYRVQRKKPIWATSNLRPDQVTSVYTEDIASMLKECMIPVQVTGEDMRDREREAIKKKYL